MVLGAMSEAGTIFGEANRRAFLGRSGLGLAALVSMLAGGRAQAGVVVGRDRRWRGLVRPQLREARGNSVLFP